MAHGKPACVDRGMHSCRESRAERAHRLGRHRNLFGRDAAVVGRAGRAAARATGRLRPSQRDVGMFWACARRAHACQRRSVAASAALAAARPAAGAAGAAAAPAPCLRPERQSVHRRRPRSRRLRQGAAPRAAARRWHLPILRRRRGSLPR
eukprot:52082-Chlamydomonas_euryale.AAC.4